MTAKPSENDTDEARLDELFERAVDARATRSALDLAAWIDVHPHLATRARHVLALADEVAVIAETSLAPVAQPTLAGFTLEQEIGRGGMGVVYRARQEGLDRVVALKVLPPSLLVSERARERFRSEARALARLNHTNIVTIHEVFTDETLCAYAMEWIDGPTLAAAIESGALRGHVRPVAELGVAIARALQAVHEAGLVHRDVKPSNVLLRADGTPLLSDFSLVREAATSQWTATGEFLGTLVYSAPEQIRGAHAAVGPQSDVYSLGVTLYAALAGSPPFRGSSTGKILRRIEDGDAVPLEQVAPHVPRDLVNVIAKAMAMEPAGRYATASEMADDLQRFLRHEPVLASRVGWHVRAWQLTRRRPALITSGVLATQLVIVTPLALYVQERAAFARERMLREEADDQRKVAEDATIHARDEAEVQREFAGFLRELIERGNATQAGGRADVTLLQALDEASAELLASKEPRRPPIEYTIRNALADLYIGMGKVDAAAQHLAVAEEARKALYADDSEEAATTAFHLGRVYRELGRLQDSERMMAEAVRVRRAIVTKHVGHPEHALKANYLAQALASLGIARRRLEDYDGALAAYNEALALYTQELGEDNENVAQVLSSIATLHSTVKRHDEAERVARRALEIATRFHGGPDGTATHMDIGHAITKLGAVLSAAGRLEEGGKRLREGVASLRASVGTDHKGTIDAALELSNHHERTGERAELVPLLTEVLTWCEALEHLGSQRSLRCATKLVDALLEAGRAEEAEALLLRGLDAARPAVEALGWPARLERARAIGPR